MASKRESEREREREPIALNLKFFTLTFNITTAFLRFLMYSLYFLVKVVLYTQINTSTIRSYTV